MFKSKSLSFGIAALVMVMVDLSYAETNPAPPANAMVEVKPTPAKYANSLKFDLAKNPSKVEFFIIGKPSMLKINGTGAKLYGFASITENVLNANVGVPLKNLTTGIELRDEHMKNKYLDVEKYPYAILKILNADLGKNILSGPGEIKNLKTKGQLKIRGITKDVDIDLSLSFNEKSISIDATTKFLITEFGIEIPSYMGIKIADEVIVITSAQLKK